MMSNRLRREEIEADDELLYKAILKENMAYDEAENDEIENESEPKFSNGRSLFSLLLANDLIAKEKAIAFLPFFFFLALLGMFYIGNRHLAEKKSRQVNQLKKDIKELKWDYMSTKAELMLQSKQSEVSAKALSIGLHESIRPPQKIVLEEK